MTDSPTMTSHRRDKWSLDAWSRRNPMKLISGVLGVGVLFAGAVALSTMNSGPHTLGPGDSLASITGTKPALDIGEDWRRPVSILSNDRLYPVDYQIARMLSDKTDTIGIVVNVPLGAVVEKKNWHWHYRPPQ